MSFSVSQFDDRIEFPKRTLLRLFNRLWVGNYKCGGYDGSGVLGGQNHATKTVYALLSLQSEEVLCFTYLCYNHLIRPHGKRCGG